MWTGVAGAGAPDASAGQRNCSSTAASTVAITTTSAGDVIVGAINFPLAITASLATQGFVVLEDFGVSTSAVGPPIGWSRSPHRLGRVDDVGDFD